MHEATRSFLECAKDRFPDHFFGPIRVLEVGSRDVNGSAREYFSVDRYVGIDCVDGDGVDIVSVAHRSNVNGTFRTVVCTNTLEHDPNALLTVGWMISRMGPGSLLLISVPTRDSKPHGIKGRLYGPEEGHYKGLEVEDVLSALASGGSWSSVTADRDADPRGGAGPEARVMAVMR